MAKKILTFASLFILVILQISFLPGFFASDVAPNLILIILIFLAARQGFSAVWLKTIVAGLLLDLFSFYPAGINVISFLAAILMTSLLARRFLVTAAAWRFLVLILLVIIGTSVNDFIVAILAKVFWGNHGLAGIFSWEFGMKALNNALVFSLIYWPLKKYEKLKNFYQQGAVLKDNVR